MQNIKDLLKLTLIPKIGTQKIKSLINKFQSAENIFKASEEELICIEGISKQTAKNILNNKISEKIIAEQLKQLNKIGAKIITLWDKEYPELLKNIYDPPVILFVLGNFKASDLHAIALVGTRHPSQYGSKIAENFTQELAQRKITVISGLARGIDTIVHTTALKNKTRTIAVIGSGLDVIYPPENKKLFEQIAEKGAVVSEFCMGTQPLATHFPRRNRIISGLSLGTVVIESSKEGGAMITASTALDQNREVFAVPGNILDKKSEGTNKLIKEGRAKLITCVDDILSELFMQLELPLENKLTKPKIGLTNTEEKIYQLLNSNPIHIDTLAETTEMSTSDLLVLLLSLEFKNAIKQLPGKMFVRT